MSAEAFWAFSLDFYSRPNVAASCLALQDDCGADVDVLLFALWCASRGHRLSTFELAGVDAAIDPWRKAVVQPIRLARRALKPAPPGSFDPAATAALREQLLSAELAAERLQQNAMEMLVPPSGTIDPGDAARDNLACFAREIDIPSSIPLLAALLEAFG